MPGLQARSPVGGVWEATDRSISRTSIFLSLSSTPSIHKLWRNLLKSWAQRTRAGPSVAVFHAPSPHTCPSMARSHRAQGCAHWISTPLSFTLCFGHLRSSNSLPRLAAACLQRPAQISHPHPLFFCRPMDCWNTYQAWQGAAAVGRVWAEMRCVRGPPWGGTGPGRGGQGEVHHRLQATDRGQGRSPCTFTFCQGSPSCLRVNSNPTLGSARSKAVLNTCP